MSARRPAVSVIVVTRNTREVTLRCLDSLSQNTTSGAYEVIVVDNASSDGTSEDLRHSPGIRLIRNDENLGFGVGVNMGAAQATGRYLLLLNSDAFVEPGWLDPLLAAMEADPGTAAVVPMVLNLDGSLQEAAALVSGDGRTIAHGSGADPADPAYRFPRFVDYGSALCMLVRRRAFEAVGGFDPVYGLGYCEDVDLCFRFAERGWRVRYEPRSRVLHVGGASSDPQTIEELVSMNTRTLRARWGGFLSRRPPLTEWAVRPHRLVESRDIEALDRILVAAGPEVSAVSREFLEAAAQMWPAARFTLMSEEQVDDAEDLMSRGIEVIRVARDHRSWFRDRLLHYSVVVIDGPAAAAGFGAELHHTQPHALFVYSMEPAAEGTAFRSAEVAELRRSDAAWCASLPRLALAADLAPAAGRFLVPERGWSRDQLAGVMAHLGIGPPAAHRKAG